MAVFGTKANPRATTVVAVPEQGALKYKTVTAIGNTATEIIATPGASKKLLILAYSANSDVAGEMVLQDDAGTPVVHARHRLAINANVVVGYGAGVPAFELAKNVALDATQSGTTPDASVNVVYVEVPA